MATNTIKNFSGYVDLDLTFQLHPAKKDLMLSIGEVAVSRALKNLLLTNYYEKPFKPDYGSNLRKLLFEPMSPITTSALSKEVEYVIRNFDKRVTLQSVDVEALYDYNVYQVTITFYIENLVEPFTADFILSRLR
jgi:phage baseplate assembly protein W